jgi:hypothetical protein
VITGPERRRRWTDDQKRAIVAESLALVNAVARRTAICPAQSLALRGLRSGWRASCGDLHPDRHRQAQRHRSAGLARRRAAPHRRPPRLASPRTSALELQQNRRMLTVQTSGSAWLRRLAKSIMDTRRVRKCQGSATMLRRPRCPVSGGPWRSTGRAYNAETICMHDIFIMVKAAAIDVREFARFLLSGIELRPLTAWLARRFLSFETALLPGIAVGITISQRSRRRGRDCLKHQKSK